jgi:hypothetical protein
MIGTPLVISINFYFRQHACTTPFVRNFILRVLTTLGKYFDIYTWGSWGQPTIQGYHKVFKLVVVLE